ncbi:monovalent cation/H+ antiporter complex subunit F [Rhodococcus sp. NPDC003382]|uniref:monovalent cation/H+ antiporter complex subunit F n=1 Tax=unclassified Rhodococcus (in: high G+C Gram-positive bacteria) TaxID=192944 RepID=UPI0018CD071A|nr:MULTISPECIES: monovalent cation/H+ antiporter complex subunit F [unclassified Rhodococcus (in: high G+C Gram-positive bacteria)]MBH0118290.1 cation:proton antiporter [Rhodococcus sp. CX]MCK8669716.1 monovalent cation/H+ antiporter complex subunit F [Rhodococcus sp. HM1]
MTTILTVSGVLLLISALLTTLRVLAGPTSLDRLVAVDAILAIAMCGLALWAVYTRDTTIAPAIVALALVGFLGSVSVARFRVRDDR